MRKVNFENRDGYNVWAEEVDTCRWLIKHNLPDWATWNITGTEDNIMAIDPMGGPMIGIGTAIDDEQVTGIENTKEGWILKTK